MPSSTPSLTFDRDVPSRTARAVPGLALAGAGLAISLIARGQPAWIDTQIGPGLLAQLLGAGVIVLGLIWAAWCMATPAQSRQGGCGSGPTENPQSGPALLGAVLGFTLCVPVFGLVIAAGMAATLAALGAGERRLRALLITVLGLTALTAAVGVGFLPPTAPLWPAP